jgi:hypothetical protein
MWGARLSAGKLRSATAYSECDGIPCGHVRHMSIFQQGSLAAGLGREASKRGAAPLSTSGGGGRVSTFFILGAPYTGRGMLQGSLTLMERPAQLAQAALTLSTCVHVQDRTQVTPALRIYEALCVLCGGRQTSALHVILFMRRRVPRA